jgi:hypothetical protein
MAAFPAAQAFILFHANQTRLLLSSESGSHQNKRLAAFLFYN